jgi:hypothetical protein
MRRWLLAMLFCLFAAGHAAAHSASGGGYSLRVEGEDGATLPTYEHGGVTYVRGEYGQRYNLRISNSTGHRVEAVVTVDGRDVLTGETGDFVHQRGYVVPAWGSVVIDGFRQSYSDVAAFRFTSPGESYSARRGTPENVGVVGVAIFRERSRPAVARPRIAVPPTADDSEPKRRGDADRSGGASAEAQGAPKAQEPSAAPPRTGTAAGDAPAGGGRAYDYGYEDVPRDERGNIGTLYGETRYSPVTEVQFVRARADRPDRVLTVYYDDARGLASRGIPVRPSPWTAGPAAFPENDRRFAPPPP